MPSGCRRGRSLRLIEAEVRKQLDAGSYQEGSSSEGVEVELWHPLGHGKIPRRNMIFAGLTEREGDTDEPRLRVKQ